MSTYIDNESTLKMMPTLLRGAVENVLDRAPGDVFFNAHRNEALVYVLNLEAETDGLISVTYYPETGKTWVAKSTAVEWLTGWEG